MEEGESETTDTTATTETSGLSSNQFDKDSGVGPTDDSTKNEEEEGLSEHVSQCSLFNFCYFLFVSYILIFICFLYSDEPLSCFPSTVSYILIHTPIF